MNASMLRVQELRKVYRTREPDSVSSQELIALDGISFEVAKGGSMAIVGESGSGKSTCARLIVGLEQATSGSIEVNGECWMGGHLRASERRRRGGVIQMVFQDPYQSLDRRQRVEDVLDVALRLHDRALSRSARRSRIGELVDMVGLDERQTSALPRHLSGGQRQRVAIARALAAQPELLILDEAVAALDVSIQAQVLNVLADIRDQTGIAFLFISHDLAVVRHLCDDVVVLHRGQVVEAGPTTSVLDNPHEDYTRRLRDSIPRPGWAPRRRGTELFSERGA